MDFFSSLHIVKVALPKSEVDLVPGSGVRLSIGNAFITLNGHWRVKYLRIMWEKTPAHCALSLKSYGDISVLAVTCLSTERTAAHLIWMWMTWLSVQLSASRAMRRVVLQSVASAVQPISAAPASNSTVEPGKVHLVVHGDVRQCFQFYVSCYCRCTESCSTTFVAAGCTISFIHSSIRLCVELYRKR